MRPRYPQKQKPALTRLFNALASALGGLASGFGWLAAFILQAILALKPALARLFSALASGLAGLTALFSALLSVLGGLTVFALQKLRSALTLLFSALVPVLGGLAAFLLHNRKSALALLFSALFLILGGVAAFNLLSTEDSPPAADAEGAEYANTGSAPESNAEYPQGKLAPSLTFDALLMEKSKHRLTAFSKGKAVRVYLVALGEAPVGPKEYQGDRKTPEGKYRINDKNPNSAYYKTLGISYPSEKDRERATRLGKNPGGDIKIHGLARQFASLGADHRLTDWTYGSIAVTNPEMEELFQRTPLDTPIEIKP